MTLRRWLDRITGDDTGDRPTRRLPFPRTPDAGMTYANWRFGVPDIASVRSSFHIDNDPGPRSDLYLQLYDASIDGTGTYHGVQTINLALLSRWGTQDAGEVRPMAPDAYVVVRDDEGPYVSLRMPFAIGIGSFTTSLRRTGDGDAGGDWFEFAVGRGPEETVVGAMRFPRRRPDVPATFADGGGSWTEYWDNCGPAVLPVPYWKVRIDPPVANGATPAEGVTFSYSRMPNGLIDWDAQLGQVVTEIGGDVMRGSSTPRVVRLR